MAGYELALGVKIDHREGGIGGPLALVILRWAVRRLVTVEPEEPVAEPLRAAVGMLAVRAA